ncbi:MAG: hypothetical protein PHG24_02130 [Candidatus Pacebacteria bacterium]|nr:hypothetical protein [Candidatus Paceibacterota bacterium]
MKKEILKFIITFVLIFCFTNNAFAETIDERTFYVDPSFSDNSSSYTLKATRVLQKNGLDIYIDSNYFNTKTLEEQSKIKEVLTQASERFKINQAKVISIFGREAYPGIDNNNNLVVLLQPLKNDAKGYIRVIDKYEKIVAPMSNESEMVYLDVLKIDSPFFDSFIIHEYTHLIFINQKNVSEAYLEENTWLAELYSEYAATMIQDSSVYGYFDQRIKDFFQNPSSALIYWSGDNYDYSVITLLAHYIVDNYGKEILSESMKSTSVGIESLDLALKRKGYTETFEDIFKNFIVALAINDCSSNNKYCFKNEKLKNFTILPFANFLPFSGNAIISIGQSIYNWSAQWQKFSGGSGNLEIMFNGEDGTSIKARYVAKTKTGKNVVGDLELNTSNEGKVAIPEMSTEYDSIIIIPYIADRSLPNSLKKWGYEIKAQVVDSEIEENEEEQSFEDIFNITKPLNQMTQRELLILLIKILLLKQQGYSF